MVVELFYPNTELNCLMFFSKKLALSEQELVNIAKQACEKENWPWLEPVRIQNGFGKWTVVTNYEAIGCNVRIVISKKTGEVVDKFFMPR